MSPQDVLRSMFSNRFNECPSTPAKPSIDPPAERAQSAYFADTLRPMDTGNYNGEHACVVSATPKPKHKHMDHPQARSYSAGCFAAPTGGAAARRACADAEATRPARRKLLAYTSVQQFSQLVEVYRGSVSTVYKAVEDATGCRVVIKAYHKVRMQAKHHHKLRREVAIAGRMNGDYVTQMYGTCEDEENVYIIMELCEGGDLFKSMMLHGGRLDEVYVCLEIIAPLLRVLEKMHKLQLMHRDIKPENIFLTRGGQLKLGDFGLAVNFAQEIPFSRSGTLDYMAPEVLKNPVSQLQEGPGVTLQQLAAKNIKPYTTQVDVWAVGILAYELVCGKPPFEVEDEAKTASLIMYSTQIRFPPTHSAAWSDFVRVALSKDPEERADSSALLQHPCPDEVDTAPLRPYPSAPVPLPAPHAMCDPMRQAVPLAHCMRRIQHNLHRARNSSGGCGEHEKLFHPLPLEPQLCGAPAPVESPADVPLLSHAHSTGELVATHQAARIYSCAGYQHSIGTCNLHDLRHESAPPSLLASATASTSPAAPTSMFKESLSLGRTASATSSSGNSFSSVNTACGLFGLSGADGVVSLGVGSRANSGGAALPPRASPLSKMSACHPSPTSANHQQSGLQLQPPSDPGRISAGTDPLYQQFQEQQQQYMQQFAAQQAALAHRKAAPVAVKPPLPLLSHYGSGSVTSPRANLSGYGDGVCDSPQPGPGTKERLKFYLTSQKMGHGI